MCMFVIQFNTYLLEDKELITTTFLQGTKL